MMSKLDLLLKRISAFAENNTLLKITLGNKKSSQETLKNVFIKPVLIKNESMLSFVYRYPMNDITKNFLFPEAIITIKALLQQTFLNADVFTAAETIYFSVDKSGKGKMVSKKVEQKVIVQSQTHDKQKQRIINSNAVYLKELGITGAEGKVKKEMQHKYKQINRYVEIVEGILKDVPLKKGFSVADMGSGKGYLTFALYDHLKSKSFDTTVTGIEMRDDLVNKCNNIATLSGFKNLHFKKGTIQDIQLHNIDMLIALHACDTATDDAIFKGIKAGAEVIICAPCCHKQIRKQMAPQNALRSITKHGILLERQAEMVTDTIRSLILEAQGYKTKVFEFIDEEDTPKNVLIVGVKNKKSDSIFAENMEKVGAIKSLFGIQEHYLETLF
jgi:hypothetical protein